MGEQSMYERPFSMARSGMDYEAGRLVHYDQVLVFEKNVQGHRLGLEGLIGPRPGDLCHNEVARPGLVARLDGSSIYLDQIFFDQFFEMAARKVRDHPAQKQIKPLPALFVGNHKRIRVDLIYRLCQWSLSRSHAPLRFAGYGQETPKHSKSHRLNHKRIFSMLLKNLAKGFG